MVFSRNTSFSDDDLHHVFGTYGEIKEVCFLDSAFCTYCVMFQNKGNLNISSLWFQDP